jgi:hypothetical protein
MEDGQLDMVDGIIPEYTVIVFIFFFIEVGVARALLDVEMKRPRAWHYGK